MLYLLRLLAVIGLCLGLRVAAAGTAAPLPLDDRQAVVDGWPAVTMLADASHRLDLAAVLQRRAAFAPPATPAGNLGKRADAVWLHLPLQPVRSGRWVLAIDYPPLQRADVHLLVDGRWLSTHRLGGDQPFDQRPLKARAHALDLPLDAGRRYELLLRVRTETSMLVPIALHRADAFGLHEAQRQILQGLMLGVALTLLVYSIVNAVSLRDPLFAHYGLMLLGIGIFFVSYSGIGNQHLWNEQTGLMAQVAPLGILLALMAGGLFFARALGAPAEHPIVTRGLHAIAALAGVLMLLVLTGLLDYRHAQTAATVLGPLPLMLALRPAIIQARRGSVAARMLLIGWGAYLVGALAMAGLLRGLLPAHFWVQHLFQFATLVEMLAWMRVLGLRIGEVKRDAERAELERHTLHSLAHTDPLTGLPNRRGLHDALGSALAPGQPGRSLAVFMLDLDGFKAVNDRLGHEAGDTLLVQVAQRLRSQVRSGDVVARLGGDEFVVMALSLGEDADAQALGRKLLDAFRQTFDVAGHRCAVGLTIGYALAPLDGQDARTLLRRADEAMYAGKQAGRHCLRRAPAAAPTALAVSRAD